jgi:hypothetical protein
MCIQFIRDWHINVEQAVSPIGGSMKTPVYSLLLAASTIAATALGQCAKPEMKPVWDVGGQQFKCVASSGSQDMLNDETVSPQGNKEFCNKARESLLKACPLGGENKNCKENAKTIFNTCYKDSKAQGESRSSSSTPQATRTDSTICTQTFAQQQKACNSRKVPPPAPGQPSVPDTCLQDAMAAQNSCLANSH